MLLPWTKSIFSVLKTIILEIFMGMIAMCQRVELKWMLSTIMSNKKNEKDEKPSVIVIDTF